MEGFLTVLPMAVVMSAGPQIVTATFLATSHSPKRNSLAFLAAVGAATTIGVTIFFLFGSSLAGEQDEGKSWFDWLIVALLVILVIWVYLRRNETEPPKWMGKLERADPRFAAKIGFMALLLMGERAETRLPQIRQWMNDNSWIVNEGVLLLPGDDPALAAGGATGVKELRHLNQVSKL